MTEEKRTHNSRDDKQVPFDYFTIRPDHEYGGYVVHGFGEYGRSSVLAGQTMKACVGCYSSRKEALAVYPEAGNGHDMLDPQVSLNHLPGEDDPVAGGMYPDDIDGGGW